MTKPYYLKLQNSGENYCFANSVIQMLISCGSTLYEKVFNLKNKCIFSEIFIKILTLHNQKSDLVVSCKELTQLINKNVKHPDDCYTNNTQQDSFGFFLSILESCHSEITELFKFSYMEINKCENCGTETKIGRIHTNLYIGLERTKGLNQISFEELFFPKMHIIDCNSCKSDKQIKYHNYLEISEYLLIRIPVEYKNHRLNSKITNFVPDNIKIPNIPATFNLISAICHLNNNKTVAQIGGHFVCYTRTNDQTWLKISDTYAELKSLPKNLENVYMLLFKKC